MTEAENTREMKALIHANNKNAILAHDMHVKLPYTLELPDSHDYKTDARRLLSIIEYCGDTISYHIYDDWTQNKTVIFTDTEQNRDKLNSYLDKLFG